MNFLQTVITGLSSSFGVTSNTRRFLKDSFKFTHHDDVVFNDVWVVCGFGEKRAECFVSHYFGWKSLESHRIASTTHRTIVFLTYLAPTEWFRAKTCSFYCVTRDHTFTVSLSHTNFVHLSPLASRLSPVDIKTYTKPFHSLRQFFTVKSKTNHDADNRSRPLSMFPCSHCLLHCCLELDSRN